MLSGDIEPAADQAGKRGPDASNIEDLKTSLFFSVLLGVTLWSFDVAIENPSF